MVSGSVALLLIIAVFIINTGFVFINDPVELDPDKHRIYAGRTVEGLYADASKGLSDSCYAVTGKIQGIGKKYDTFKLMSDDGKTSVSCITKETDVKNEAALLSDGDRITVYGIFSRDLIGKGIHGDIISLKEGEIKTGDDVFLNIDGRVFDKDETVSREIVNPLRTGSDIISFRIPSDWQRWESVIDDKGDHIYGLQYRLNRLDNKNTPESLYVFYLDYNKNLSDRSQYDRTEGIEKAVVKNILNKKDVGRCPESEKKASYGVKYQYYDDKYESGDDTYHAEFVFRENGSKGMIVYLYIYRLPDHADDIMYLMRSTEVGNG